MVQAQTDFIRQIPLVTNDIAFSASTGKLYASVPSRAGIAGHGNTITIINPSTGAIENSVFIGSEPNVLSMASDGNSLQVSLDGAFAIRKFDTQTQTPGLQFLVGQDQFFGRFRVNDLAVAPGNPDLVAVARHFPGLSPPEAGVAVFDTGVQRPNVGPGHLAGSDFLAFSASATKLYGGGFSGTLTTMTIDSNGVTVSGTLPFGVGARIKFNNGRVFSSTGQVINPDAGTLLGTFSNATSNAFVADSSVGRAYYVVGGGFGGGPLTLRAFDINTFLVVGTLAIPGATGDPLTLVRWGANGLALRTSSNQLFLIQTSLIPSAEPIPTPTPTPSPGASPSPTPFATFVRQIPLATNDLIFDPPTQKLYASVPSTAGAIGNSITAIDPVAGTIGTSTFIGSEPTKIARSDDGQTLQVALDGAGSVRRFNIATQTAGQQFFVGMDEFFGVYAVNDLAIAPGNPGLVAVARHFRGISPPEAGVVVFDNGVQRPNAGPGHLAGSDFLAFSNSATTLYGAGFSDLSTITVDASGVTVNDTVPFSSGNGIKFHNGLIYGGFGQVINPTTKLMAGSFTNTGFGFFNSFAVDAANGRVFFLITEGSNVQIRAYDINTFVPIGSINIEGNFGFTLTSLVRWGSNGLAFRSTDKVFLIQTALVNSTDPVPAPTPTPSPTPSPSPPHIPTFVRKLSLPANGLVFSQHNQSLYASVPSSAGANGNSITKIVPETGVTGPSIFIGSEPNKLALSDNGQTLYAHLDGAIAIRRFDIPSHTAGLQFTAGNQPPIDMEVLPGSPQSLAVSRSSFNGVAIFDNEVQRPNVGSSNFGIGFIDFGATASTLYGLSTQELVKFSVDNSGLSQSTVTRGLLNASVSSFEFVNGLLYSGSGTVADPEAKLLKGRFQSGFSNSFVVDQANGRIFFLTGDNPPVLRAFDINTFLPLGAVTLNSVTGMPVNLVRWGVNGLAFNTVGNFFNTQSNVYLLQTALVSNAGTIPTGVQFSSDNFFTFESTGTIQVTVSRTGDISSATSVDFSTSNGTATAGSDYTSTSGTLTFAAGQLSRTISIPIIDDNLFEGANETINVNLTNPTGGALLAGPATAVVTINDNDFRPFVSIAPSLNEAEGNSGTSNFTFNVTLSNPSVEVVTVDFTTENGTATAGSDYVATSGKLTFQSGTTSLPINITVNGDTEIEGNETFVVKLSNVTNGFLSSTQGTVTIRNDDATLQFSAAQTNVSESENTVVLTVTRVGDTSVVGAINFITSDTAGGNNCNVVNGAASFRCDYSTTIGSLRFDPGQTSQTISISIVNDSYAEGDETFNVVLSNASGALLGAVSTATVKITDNETVNGPNPIEEAQFFVRQHYRDFLNREPDAGGLAFWTNEITSCFPDPTCREIKRINVSAAFFLSIEFENTGFLVYRMFKTAYGDTTSPNVAVPVPIIRLNEFLPDAQRIGLGVQVGIGPWEAQLEANKNAYAREFVVRQRFLNEYPLTMTPAQFVDKLNLTAGGVLSQSERDQLVAELTAAGDVTQGRASVLRKVAEDTDLRDRERNRAFVLMQYYGYMRRNPDDPQDTDFRGWEFWLNKLNQFNGNFIQAEMVKAFIDSIEYRQRFGP